jgi:hypothetical protein
MIDGRVFCFKYNAVPFRQYQQLKSISRRGVLIAETIIM